jgi:hypothetical protein
MLIYTTCAACKLLLNYTGTDTHPNCPDPAPDGLTDAYTAAIHAGNDTEAERIGAILDRPPPPPRLADAAMVYAKDYGWPVFPLAPGGKLPAIPKREGGQGFKDATTDIDQITRWWKRWPRANVGLPTGHRFDVLDVDTPKGTPKPEALAKLTPDEAHAVLHGGWRSYWTMQDNDLIPDVHAMVSTAGGGLHLYLEPSGEGNRGGMLPGVDYRGVGGYVVAPPSVVNGRDYHYRHRPSPVIRK